MASLILEILKDIPVSAAMKERILALESENQSVKTERDLLAIQARQNEKLIDDLNREIAELKSEVHRLTVPTGKLSAWSSEVLKMFASSNESNIALSELFNASDLTRLQFDYAIDDLRQRNLIRSAGYATLNSAVYRLTQLGRECFLRETGNRAL